MFRTVLAVATIAIAATAVSAQSDPISVRKALMKNVGDHTKIGGAMAKGEMPYDQAKAQAIFALYVEAAGKMPDLFPADSKTGGDTSAAAKIWEDMNGFKAGFAKMSGDAKAAQSAVKDFESFKATFGGVTKNCSGCHESFRIKKS